MEADHSANEVRLDPELERWLEPFLTRLAHKTRRRMCPLYTAGLIGPGERKSIQPMAQRLVPGEDDQLIFRRLVCGMRRRWRRNFLFRRSGLSAVTTPYW